MYLIYCSNSSKVEQYENSFEYVHLTEKKYVIDPMLKEKINKLDDQSFKTDKIIRELQNNNLQIKKAKLQIIYSIQDQK